MLPRRHNVQDHRNVRIGAVIHHIGPIDPETIRERFILYQNPSSDQFLDLRGKLRLYGG